MGPFIWQSILSPIQTQNNKFSMRYKENPKENVRTRCKIYGSTHSINKNPIFS